ncbi:polysaccharide pyruvyl transferase family protein [Citricoccus muralis]|uniref:Polysaccharide pyruvyl transferase WcaK-like protein n=1 Tax=Citricoccus muralis TaxID=169134 RepID=A0A3D9LAN8_9MICC|nr:polysaccharide pyruvyl transferase family protein [Citricoccus muralis]REE02754.1 polysaccharide pyruvyl transferase WcaK-like protein [Citricoccus muralis]
MSHESAPSHPNQEASRHRVVLVRRRGSRHQTRDAGILRALHLLGHTVFDLDLRLHPACLVPEPGTADQCFDHDPVEAVFRRQAPDIVLMADDGLVPSESTSAFFAQHGIVAVALSDDVPGDAAEHGLEALFGDLRSAGLVRPGETPLPRTVLFSGYYGAGNRGDELLLDTLVSHLQDTLPGFQPVVAGSKPAVVEREHGVQSLARADLEAGEEYAERASSLVLGPGGHWHDYSIKLAGGAAGIFRGAHVSPAHMAQLPLLVSAYGGAVHVRGMGVGPLTDPAARAAVNLTGRLARTITVRDHESAGLLEPMSEAWPAAVEVSPDVVYGLALPSPGTGTVPESLPDRYLAVNLRPWSDHPDRRRELHKILLDTARDHGLAIVGVPMQSTDEAALRDLAATAEASGSGVAVTVVPAGIDLPGFLEVLRGAEALVAMRLHANLLMHRLRRPTVGLVYDPKVGSHFAELGRSEWALDLAVAGADLRDALDRLLRDGELPPATHALVDGLEERARGELDRLTETLASDPLRIPDPAWVRYPAPAAKKPPQKSPAAPAATTTPTPATKAPATSETTAASRPLQPVWRRAARRIYRGVRRRLR